MLFFYMLDNLFELIKVAEFQTSRPPLPFFSLLQLLFFFFLASSFSSFLCFSSPLILLVPHQILGDVLDQTTLNNHFSLN